MFFGRTDDDTARPNRANRRSHFFLVSGPAMEQECARGEKAVWRPGAGMNGTGPGEVVMSPARSGPPLILWNPFMAWESSQLAIETNPADRPGSESLESALPASVETADAEDAVMAPEGFTHWF